MLIQDTLSKTVIVSIPSWIINGFIDYRLSMEKNED